MNSTVRFYYKNIVHICTVCVCVMPVLYCAVTRLYSTWGDCSFTLFKFELFRFLFRLFVWIRTEYLVQL